MTSMYILISKTREDQEDEEHSDFTYLLHTSLV